MNPRDLIALAKRAWTAAGASEREHWGREYAARGEAVTFQASQALWIHMRAVRPDWPSEQERRADLAHHVALKRLLDRAAGADAALPAR
jgi:hypothetical protein